MAEIDLTQLPAPDAIEQFDFETILARKKQRLIELCPESIRPTITATLELESEPLTIDLQQQAYSEMLIRQRINEATRAGFLAFATGADLDHIGATRGLVRKTIQRADYSQNPPITEIKESDAEYRKRIQMHPEKFAAAGPRAAYIAHALDIDDVADANPVQPQAGTVRVYIKSYSNNGIPNADLLKRVANYLSAESRRPLCDKVEVHASQPKTVHVSYQTIYESGIAKDLITQQQQNDLQQLFADNTNLGGSIALSKIIGALDVVGAKKIILIQPTADIICQDNQFIKLGSITAGEAI